MIRNDFHGYLRSFDDFYSMMVRSILNLVSSGNMITVAKGTRDITLQSFVNALLGTILFMLMARMLSQEEMGVYGALNLTITIGIMSGILGLDFAATRYVPYFQGRNEIAKVRITSKKIVSISLVSSAAATLTFYLLSQVLSKYMFGTEAYTSLIQITSLTIFPTIVGFIMLGFLQGLQKFSRIAAIRFLAQVVRLGSTVILLVAGFSVLGVMLGWAVFYTMIILLTLPIVLRSIISKRESTQKQRPDQGGSLSYRELLSFSLPMMTMYLLNYVINSLDQYVVLGITGIGALGGYFVATTASGIILTVLGLPLIMTLTPSFSEVHGMIGVEGVTKNVTYASRYIMLFFTPATFILATLSPIALYILAGVNYVEASIPLAIMSLGLSTYGLSALLTSTLTAIAKTKTILIVLTLSLLMELGASVILTPIYGLTGAAMSRFFMYTGMLILFIYLGGKQLPVKFDKGALTKSLAASIIMSLGVFAIASITGFNLFLLPLYLITSLIIYLMGLIGMKELTRDDIIFTFKILPASDQIFTLSRSFVNSSPNLKRLYKKLIMK